MARSAGSEQVATTRTASRPGATVRILIAEDHAIVREGVRMILEAEPDFDVIGEAKDGREAVAQASVLHPDVVVVDISMPEMTGIDATQEIKRACPGTHVLILTMHEEESYVFQLLQLGASGYVLKRAAATDLVEAVRAAARGEAFLYPSVARGVVRDYLERMRTGEGRDRYDGLTQREQEILVQLADGLTNAQIADRLGISIKTVQTHRAHIMEKLDLHDRSLLVRYAVRKGLIQP